MQRFTISTPLLRLELADVGARITRIQILRNEEWIDVHEYYPQNNPYLHERKYSGATIGPFANRIKNASFFLNGKKVSLFPNENKHLLHSGTKGLHAVKWHRDLQTKDTLVFRVTRSEQEDAFPGKREYMVKYSVSNREIQIEYNACSDTDTVINLTNHAYFNLNNDQSLEKHHFSLDTAAYLAVDEEMIPTGVKVSNQEYEFQTEHIRNNTEKPFDHCFVLKNKDEEVIVAKATGEDTGISLYVKTNQPGLQFYTGNKKFFCFETQHFPDSVHHDHFPSTLLKAGEDYNYFCSYAFTVKK